MKHSLVKQLVESLERKIFDCTKCKELSDLRETKEHNCPVLGFNYNHYLNAKVLSLCEAPGVYKPHKGEIFIDKYENFHKAYDDRIQNVANIGKQLYAIFGLADLQWSDIQHFNVICCSPPNYRTPTQDEVENCFDFLVKRIDLLQNVKVIVAFGNVAKRAIKRIKHDKVVVKSYHPSYIWKRMAREKRKVYVNDLVEQIKHGI